MTTPAAGLATAPVLDAIAGLERADLLRFLARQRWFGAKSGAASDASIDAAVPLTWGDGAFAAVRLNVATADGVVVYQLPLAARTVPVDSLPEQVVVGAVEVHGRPMTVFDATEDPEFLRGLADALGAGAIARTASSMRWIVEPATPARLSIPQGAEIRVHRGDQSNTSVIFDHAAIVKLFRRLEPGIHPEVEVSEFLSRRAQFSHVPTILGTVQFEDPNGTRTLAGVVQELLPGARDGWTYALECARPYFAAPARGGREPTNGFLPDAKQLGAMTRALHDALACDPVDPAFAPEPVGPADVQRWADHAKGQIRDTLSLLERSLDALGASKGATAGRGEARALVERRDHYLAWVDSLAERLVEAGGGQSDLGARTRVHGDYHLGQVLRTASRDFVVIDFEGEPGRSLNARREKRSPLRDVAGMLRSFSYAASTLSASAGAKHDAPTREVRAGRWERDTRAAFLAEYLSPSPKPGGATTAATAPTGRAGLPRDPERTEGLLALFEMEKAFFELGYELNHRPDWAWIPMRGVSKLLV